MNFKIFFNIWKRVTFSVAYFVRCTKLLELCLYMVD